MDTNYMQQTDEINNKKADLQEIIILMVGIIFFIAVIIFANLRRIYSHKKNNMRFSAINYFKHNLSRSWNH